LTEPPGTAPSDEGGLIVHDSVRTSAPFCETVIVALVNETSVIVSVHCLFGQPGAPQALGIGLPHAVRRVPAAAVEQVRRIAQR